MVGRTQWRAAKPSYFAWRLIRCVEAIKESAHNHLADDLEINKAVLYLRQRDVARATDTLKSFEKRATKMATNAAVNLSTIFYLVTALSKSTVWTREVNL